MFSPSHFLLSCTAFSDFHRWYWSLHQNKKKVYFLITFYNHIIFLVIHKCVFTSTVSWPADLCWHSSCWPVCHIGDQRISSFKMLFKKWIVYLWLRKFCFSQLYSGVLTCDNTVTGMTLWWPISTPINYCRTQRWTWNHSISSKFCSQFHVVSFLNYLKNVHSKTYIENVYICLLTALTAEALHYP